jgi:hypothetical protein
MAAYHRKRSLYNYIVYGLPATDKMEDGGKGKD